MRVDTFTLIDDGTIDTVIMCDNCALEIRFLEVDREPDGTITHDGWMTLEDYFAADHECE